MTFDLHGEVVAEELPGRIQSKELAIESRANGSESRITSMLSRTRDPVGPSSSNRGTHGCIDHLCSRLPSASQLHVSRAYEVWAKPGCVCTRMPTVQTLVKPGQFIGHQLRSGTRRAGYVRPKAPSPRGAINGRRHRAAGSYQPRRRDGKPKASRCPRNGILREFSLTEERESRTRFDLTSSRIRDRRRLRKLPYL